MLCSREGPSIFYFHKACDYRHTALCPILCDADNESHCSTHPLQALNQLVSPYLPFYAPHRIQTFSLSRDSALEKVNSCFQVVKLNINIKCFCFKNINLLEKIILLFKYKFYHKVPFVTLMALIFLRYTFDTPRFFCICGSS